MSIHYTDHDTRRRDAWIDGMICSGGIKYRNAGLVRKGDRLDQAACMGRILNGAVTILDRSQVRAAFCNYYVTETLDRARIGLFCLFGFKHPSPRVYPG